MSKVDALRRAVPALGMWCQVPHAFSVEAVCREKPDFVCFDQQHALFEDSLLAQLIRIVVQHGSLPLVRVPAATRHLIARALDSGAAGIIVPMIEHRREVEEIVRSSHYRPRGTRSFGPFRAEFAWGSDDLSVLDDVIVMVMIETAAGVANVEEIAATPGLDGIMIGPADLSLSMGLTPRESSLNPDVVASVRIIVDACRRNNILCAANVIEPATLAPDHGYSMLALGTDLLLLRDGIRGKWADTRHRIDGRGIPSLATQSFAPPVKPAAG